MRIRQVIPPTLKLVAYAFKASTTLSDTIRLMNFATTVSNYLNGVDINKIDSAAFFNQHNNIKAGVEIAGSYTVNRIVDSLKTGAEIAVKISENNLVPYTFAMSQLAAPIGTTTSLVSETIEALVRKDNNEKAKLFEHYIKNENIIQNITNHNPGYSIFDDARHPFLHETKLGTVKAEGPELLNTFGYFMGIYAVEFAILFKANGVVTMLDALKFMIPAATIAISQDEAKKATMHKELELILKSPSHPLKTDNLEVMRLEVCRQEVFQDSFKLVTTQTNTKSDFDKLLAKVINNKLASYALHVDEYGLFTPLKILKDGSGGLFTPSSSSCSKEGLAVLQAELNDHYDFDFVRPVEQVFGNYSVNLVQIYNDNPFYCPLIPNNLDINS